MARSTKFLLMGGVAVGTMFAVAACDDETEEPVVVPPTCTANTIQCGDANMALVCPPDGSGWVSYPCAGGCADGVCSTEVCSPGMSECVNDNLAQVCPADGSNWLAVACGVGEICESGECVVDPGGRTICTAGTAECASANVVRTCDTDGTDWFYMGCPSGYVCQAGDCVVDTTNALCNPGEGFCTDASTAWVCNQNGQGFTEESCPTGTDCISGMCVGDNCIVGDEYCVDGATIATCTDGTEWTETSCAANEICAQYSMGMGAECITMSCTPDDQECGNPDDPTVSDTDYYSVCELDMWNELTWVQYQCAAPAECNPSMLNPMGYSPCASDCTPGAERCNGDNREVCQADGTWGTGTACNSGGAGYLECVVKPGSETADGLSDAICAEGVCAYLFANYGWEDELGMCSGGQILACDTTTGLLGTTAADCSTGICVGSGMLYAGQEPGMCIEECETGAERCVSPGNGPLYQDCVNGAWNTAYQACATGVCWDTTTAGVPDTICALCVDGMQRCNGDQIETCTSGAWGTATDCTIGVCQPVGATAACIAECNPGNTYCGGYSAWASDGVSLGYDEEYVCGADGMFPAMGTLCTGTETCRVTYTGVHTGCIECLDGDQGGNDLGIPDSRCASATEYEVCTDSDWPATPVACATDYHCEAAPNPPECTSCFTDGVTPCTESNLTFYGYPGCSTISPWHVPTDCGAVPDCCHDWLYGYYCEASTAYSQGSGCVPD